MPEPTDHRAEAEHWLGIAHSNWEAGTDAPDRPDPYDLTAGCAALIGIGHALLALGDAQATPATTINLSGNATREQIRDALARQTTTLRLCAICARTDDDLIHSETDRDGYHPFAVRVR